VKNLQTLQNLLGIIILSSKTSVKKLHWNLCKLTQAGHSKNLRKLTQTGHLKIRLNWSRFLSVTKSFVVGQFCQLLFLFSLRTLVEVPFVHFLRDSRGNKCHLMAKSFVREKTEPAIFGIWPDESSKPRPPRVKYLKELHFENCWTWGSVYSFASKSG